ncbi:hypothetical protein T440DRAFT_515871 [Plenodomus tracheiphilus IPT5]|uniref:Uncharacterized protein n=1 Tax=Plenodomus tracheiphilus IPT5 TaxID=1408161 RepID=A0A6A7BFJ0_9PLEO|nr:hypothetical protein T440DRAFT_515871 [Plenodomus tracheiphilus IPT5]
MAKVSTVDPCIAYGRGGAGNMRRRSSIVDAWSKIASQPSSNLVLTSSPEDHYANSKSERRVSTSSTRRRASSLWSTSTAGEHRKFGLRTLFRRSSSAEEEDEGKVEDDE